jgi:glycosyltransferase involved in cell wall biosynthesis
LVKEIHLAKSLFPQIDVISFRLGVNSDKFSDEMIHQIHFANHQVLSGARDPFFPWLISSVFEKVLRFFPIHFFPTKLISFAFNKRSFILHRFLSRVAIKYDWVVAHNPGTFYPAQAFANRTGSKLGIDIEDYHPGEYLDKKLANMALMIMRAVLPSANYCSFAAPLIQLEVEKHIPNHSSNWFTVINGFPKSEFIEPVRTKSAKLKMIWFSQNISPGRGLENFISVIEEFKDNIELHLVGALSDQNRKLMFRDDSVIRIHQPMSQSDLHRFLSDFHVGLALEPGKDLNNSIAISNKLIAYAQSGLFIVATPTPGQISFLNNYGFPNCIVRNEESEIKKCVSELIVRYKLNELQGLHQFNFAKKYSWESINPAIIEAWNN